MRKRDRRNLQGAYFFYCFTQTLVLPEVLDLNIELALFFVCCSTMAATDIFRLDGKVAWVTGGSKGLGYQFASALASVGATGACVARHYLLPVCCPRFFKCIFTGSEQLLKNEGNETPSNISHGSMAWLWIEQSRLSVCYWFMCEATLRFRTSQCYQSAEIYECTH